MNQLPTPDVSRPVYPKTAEVSSLLQLLSSFAPGDVNASRMLAAATKEGMTLPQAMNDALSNLINHQRSLASERGPSIVLKGVGNMASMDKLNRAFPMFNLQPGYLSDDVSGHPVARAARKLDHHLILKHELRADSNFVIDVAPSGRKYDVFVKDVGGDPRPYLDASITNFHACRPVLDAADVMRVDNLALYMSNEGARHVACEATRRVAESILSHDGDHTCALPAQYCNVRAPNVVFFHSTYNIALPDIATILDRAEAIRAFVVVHAHPLLFTSAVEGVLPGIDCHFRKTKDETGRKITFSFLNDTQMSYTHRFDTYMALVCANAIVSADGNSMFAIERTRMNNLSTLYLRLVRVKNTIGSHTVACRLPRFEDGKVYLKTYRYDTLVSGVTQQLVPHVMYVSKEYLNMVIAYACSLVSGKFIVQGVEMAAHTFNVRTVIGGTTRGNPDPMDPLEVKILSYTVYVMVFIANWEGSKAAEMLRGNEDAFRELCSSGPWNALKHYVRTAFDNYANMVTKCEVVASPTDEKPVTMSWFQSYLLPYLQRKTPIHVSALPQVVDLSGVIPDFIALESQALTTYSRIPDASELRPATDAGGSFAENRMFSGAATVRDVECNERMYPRMVPGDGDCFFHSVTAILDLRDTPFVIRRRLVSSAWMRLFAPVTAAAVKDRLEASGMDGFVDADVVMLFAREYDVAICVHAGDIRRCYNHTADKRIHLCLEDQHFTPLFPTTFSRLKDTVIRVTDHPFPVPAVDGRHLMNVCVVTASEKHPTRHAGRLRRDCILASSAYHPLCHLRGLTYSSNYAMLLHAALLSDLDLARWIDYRIKVVDFSSANKSSTQYFVDGCHHNVVSLIDSAPQSCSSRYASYQLYEFIAGNVPLDDDHDLVVVNPPMYSDSLHHVDVARYCDHLASAFALLPLLRDNGAALVAVPLVSSERMCGLLSSFASNFTSCRFSYCRSVPPHNMWTMLVCAGKREVKNDMDVTHAFNGMLCATIPTLRKAFADIKAVATHKRTFEPLMTYDYTTIARLFRTRSEICAGHVLAVDAPSWVMTFGRDYLDCKGYDLGVLTDARAFTALVKRFSADVSEQLTQHLCRVLDIAHPVPDREVHAFRAAFEKSQLNGSAFLRAFVRALEANVVNTGTWVVRFKLTVDDFVANASLTVAHMSLAAAPVAMKPHIDTVVKPDATGAVLAHLAVRESTKVDVSRSSQIRAMVVKVPEQPRPADVTVREPEPDGDSPESYGFNVIAGGDGYLYPLIKSSHDNSWQKTIVDEFDKYNAHLVSVVHGECLARIARLKNGEDARHVSAGAAAPYLRLAGKRICGKFATEPKTIMGKQYLPSPLYRYAYVWDESTKPILVEAKNVKPETRNVFCCEELRIFSEYDFYLLQRNYPYEPVDLSRVGLVQAAAGCGKTTSILRELVRFRYGDDAQQVLVLTSTREGCADFMSRICEHADLRDYATSFKTQVFTIDAYCMHSRKAARFVYVDEALMQMPGKILRALSFSQCVAARLYGDRLQVPFINRSPSFVTVYPEASRVFRLSCVMDLSYRCPADVAYALDPYYRALHSKDKLNVGMRSASDAAVPSMTRVQITSVDAIPKNDKVKYLTFRQSDKEAVARKFGVAVSTVHEFQGKEANEVFLIRLTRDEGDNVFTRANHCTTAITRHRRKLTYYTCGPRNDLVSIWIDRARSARSGDIDSVRHRVS